MSDQPKWKFVANLGDVNFLEYGGYFVFVDETGKYDPQVELIEIDNEDEPDDDKLKYTIYRFDLERCTYINGILSDNKFHPDHPVWWSKELKSMAEGLDQTVEEFAAMFCSDNPQERAWAYREITVHFGPYELDSYPLKMNRREVLERFAEQVKIT